MHDALPVWLLCRLMKREGSSTPQDFTELLIFAGRKNARETSQSRRRPSEPLLDSVDAPLLADPCAERPAPARGVHVSLNSGPGRADAPTVYTRARGRGRTARCRVDAPGDAGQCSRGRPGRTSLNPCGGTPSERVPSEEFRGEPRKACTILEVEAPARRRHRPACIQTPHGRQNSSPRPVMTVPDDGCESWAEARIPQLPFGLPLPRQSFKMGCQRALRLRTLQSTA